MCVLRVSGEEFDPDSFLAGSNLQPCKIFRRGEARLPKSAPSGPKYAKSAINLAVSDRSWSELPAQMKDAEEFLTANRSELDRLTNSPGVTDATLDFPVELRINGETVVAQCDRFPASLVSIAGALGIALELSIYPCGD
jgi:hypothetical protein